MKRRRAGRAVSEDGYEENWWRDEAIRDEMMTKVMKGYKVG
jgi:hypothetical protein